MAMRFIGDVHGKYEGWQKRARRSPSGRSIQVGDFGVGFGKTEPPIFEQLDPKMHRYIRGNHDNPSVAAKDTRWIADGAQEGDMFFLGGARSIDQAMRVEGVSWWRDEEISDEVAWDISGRFFNGELQPRIMVTHDCPWLVALKIFQYPSLKLESGSKTGQVLDSLFASWKPDLWIFGHWHEDKDVVIDGTRFICLSELSYIDVDLNTLETSKIVPQ